MAWRRTDPTPGSAAVLRCIEEDAPQDVAALARALDLHPNTVRKHLARLVQAGLVVEEMTHDGRPGRPHRVYRPAPDRTHAYQRLSLLLVEAVRDGLTPSDAGRRAGDRAGYGTDAATAVRAAAADYGIDAVLEGDAIEFTACPYAAAVATDADTVCALHHGLAAGAAARHGATVTPDPLDRCRVHLASSKEKT